MLDSFFPLDPVNSDIKSSGENFKLMYDLRL
jgi:hypothetical protein